MVEGFYCQQCGATSRATCDCRAVVLARRLEERADVEAAWRAAADQSQEYIRKHADERTARKRAEAECAHLRAERDSLDCTRRGGADTLHCRPDAPCLRCRLDALFIEGRRLRDDNDRLRAELEAARQRASEAEADAEHAHKRAEAYGRIAGELKARLDKVAPHICGLCGPHARVDEEGCCAVCGGDTFFASDPYAKDTTP